jgi:hypothetical protein
MAMESEGHTVTGNMGGNDTGTEKQSTVPSYTQIILRDDSHDRTNGDHSTKTYDDTMAQEDLALSPTGMGTHVATAIVSPKRSKKLKINRDTVHLRDRTRSRTSHKTPQRM